IVRFLRFIMIKRQSTSHRLEQPPPVSPVAHHQLQIVPSIGGMLPVQSGGTQSAISIGLAAFLQQAGHGEISAEDNHTPLTDFHLASQIRNSPCALINSREEV